MSTSGIGPRLLRASCPRSKHCSGQLTMQARPSLAELTWTSQCAVDFCKAAGYKKNPVRRHLSEAGQQCETAIGKLWWYTRAGPTHKLPGHSSGLGPRLDLCFITHFPEPNLRFAGSFICQPPVLIRVYWDQLGLGSDTQRSLVKAPAAP